jgi:CHAP domain-containing protein
VRDHRSSLWFAFLLGTATAVGGGFASAQTATFGPIGRPVEIGRPTQIGRPAVVGAPITIGRPAAVGQPVVIGTPTNVGSPTQIGRPVVTGTPARAGSPTQLGRAGPIAGPRNIGIAEQPTVPVQIGRPGPIGSPIAVGRDTQVASPTSIGVPKAIGEPATPDGTAPIGHPADIGNPYITNRAIPIARGTPIGDAAPIASTAQSSATNPYANALANSKAVSASVANSQTAASTNPYSSVLNSKQRSPAASSSLPTVTLSDLPQTGVNVEPNINGGIQAQSASKSQNPFIRDWTQTPSIASAPADPPVATNAEGQKPSNAVIPSAGSSGIAGTTPAVAGHVANVVSAASPTNNPYALPLSAGQPNSVKLTPTQNEALLPSYQQAASGQTPSCVIFVRAKLLEETNGKVNFPPVNSAADLLTLAQNKQVPGLTYTPLATAVQSGQIKPGDILLWQPNVSSDGSGHVAYVSAVNGSQVTVEQRDFSSPQTRAEYPSTSASGHWLDTETIDLSKTTKIEGVLSLQ